MNDCQLLVRLYLGSLENYIETKAMLKYLSYTKLRLNVNLFVKVVMKRSVFTLGRAYHRLRLFLFWRNVGIERVIICGDNFRENYILEKAVLKGSKHTVFPIFSPQSEAPKSK